MAWDFRLAIRDMANMGFFDVILPFFLIFTVVYAILQRSNILGATAGEAKRYNIIVAMVIGLLVIVPHVMWGDPTGQSPYLSIGSISGNPVPDVVNIINRAIPQVSIWIIVVLMLMILLGMFGSKIEWTSPFNTWIFIAAVIIVLYTFAVSANWLNTPEWLSWMRDRGNQAVILILLIFGIVVWFVVSPSSGSGEGLGKKVGKAIDQLVKNE